jgi:hypothetical protein
VGRGRCTILQHCDHAWVCCTLTDMNTSAWMGLAVLLVLAVFVIVAVGSLAVLSLRRWRRRDPEDRALLRTVREQEAINLARQQWMGGGG